MKNFTEKQIKEVSALELASRIRILMELAAEDDGTQDKVSMADAEEVVAIDAELKDRLGKLTTFSAKKEILSLMKNSYL